MTNQDTNTAIPSGMEQLNAVVQAWWALPNAASPKGVETPMWKFTDFASDLQKIYADAFNRQRDLLVQGTAALSNWAPTFLPARQPQDVMEIQMKMLASLFEASAKRSEIWADLSKQLGSRYAELVHQMAQDIDQTAATLGAVKPDATHLSAGKNAT